MSHRGFHLDFEACRSRRNARRGTVGARLRRDHVRRSQRDAHRRVPHRHGRAQADGRRDRGRRARHARRDEVASSANRLCHRSVRHGRRRHRHAEYLDRLRLRGGGCGVPVAKHGNRNMSSKSGAADCAGSAGREDRRWTGSGASRCLRETGLCFLFAQAYHPAMQICGAGAQGARLPHDLQSARAALQSRARARGSWSASTIATGWSRSPRCSVGSGADAPGSCMADGLDEIAVYGVPPMSPFWQARKVTVREIAPEDAGLSWSPLSAIAGGTAEENAAALRRLFDGETGRLPRHRAAEFCRRAHGRRQGKRSEGRCRAGGEGHRSRAMRKQNSIS